MKVACVLVTHLRAKLEIQRQPHLRDRPVLIVDRSQGRPLVVDHFHAASWVAAGMTLEQALSRQTDGAVLEAEESAYRREFHRMFPSLQGVSDRVEGAELGTAYVRLPVEEGVEAPGAAGGIGTGLMPRHRIHSRMVYFFPDDFPERLSRFQRESGLSWAEIARRVGTSDLNVRHWRERGAAPLAAPGGAAGDGRRLGLAHLFIDWTLPGGTGGETPAPSVPPRRRSPGRAAAGRPAGRNRRG